MKNIIKSVYTQASLLMVTAVMLVGVLPQSAKAISTSDWQAGRIIDDSVFTDYNSMSAAQIQAFLNSQVSNCDTNGTQPATDYGRPDLTHAQYAAMQGWSAPPYVCLRNYYELPKTSPGAGIPDNSYNHSGDAPSGSISAAQMIYNAAQQYQISPKVLLIKIRSESSGPLTNDTWPLQSQYTYAMGAHCPDSGPGNSPNCDPNYAGFSIQISEAAALLRYYLNNMNQSWWPYKKPGANTIQYNPTTSCGSSVVGVSSMATAALYTYTPYQPNAAALAAGYGTAPCGAYGNRNFWLYYNDWFGSTVAYFGNAPAYTSAYAKSPCTIPTYDSTMIGRLYDPDTQDFLYTTSRTEACYALTIGYIWDSVVMQSAIGQDAIPVYRIANFERHIFTTSSTVRDNEINNYGYHDEGIAFYVYSASASDRTPVYGLQGGNTYFLTSSGKEVEYYINNYGYYNFGTVAYTPVIPNQQTSVYRLNRNGVRLYTISPVEETSAIQNYGFKLESTASQNDTEPTSTNAPVYRLRSPNNVYFYTMDRKERDAAVVNYGYSSDGIAFYGPLYTTNPVYRATNYSSANTLRVYTNDYTEYRNAMVNYGYNGEGIGWYGY